MVSVHTNLSNIRNIILDDTEKQKLKCFWWSSLNPAAAAEPTLPDLEQCCLYELITEYTSVQSTEPGNTFVWITKHARTHKQISRCSKFQVWGQFDEAHSGPLDSFCPLPWQFSWVRFVRFSRHCWYQKHERFAWGGWGLQIQNNTLKNNAFSCTLNKRVNKRQLTGYCTIYCTPTCQNHQAGEPIKIVFG